MLYRSVYYTHPFNSLFFRDYPGEPVPERKKPIWILLKQETASGSGISWAIMQVCTSLQTDNHASTPTQFLQVGDALPAAQPTSSVKALKALFVIIIIFLTSVGVPEVGDKN